MSGSSTTGMSFVPDNGDRNAGHSGGVVLVTTAAPVPVVPSSGSAYTGVSVSNTDASHHLVGTILYVPGTNLAANDSFFVVPPRGAISYSADRDSILSITLGASNLAALSGPYTEALATPLVAPANPVVAYVNFSNA